MSTLTVSNVSDGTLSIPTTYVTNGSAKAWINLDGTGTIAARDSFNVSSLVDDGTGLYTVNYSNAMANSGYATGFDGSNDTDRNNTIAFGINRTTTTIQIDVETTSGTQVDLDTVEGVVHGDLA